MTEEIRRRKTADPEMDAMQVLVQAFEPLDGLVIKRVLEWAEDRFIAEPRDRQVRLQLDGLKEQFALLKQRAEGLGVDERQLIAAVWHVRAVEKGLAPLEADDDVADTEARVVASLAS